jgi:hypothetical protein
MDRLWLLALATAFLVAVGCTSGPVRTGSPPTPTPSGFPGPATPFPSVFSDACPGAPTLADLVALDEDAGPLTAAVRPSYGTYTETGAACYGGTELRLVAFGAAPEGMGGIEAFRIDPLWLTARFRWLAVNDTAGEFGPTGPFYPVAVPPVHEAAFEELHGSWLEVTGHFSDPIADTCRVTMGDPPVAPTAEQAIEICRTVFVVTGIKPAAR